MFAAKQNIFESELYQRSDNTREWLQYIEEKAKETLNVNDYTALMKRIKDVCIAALFITLLMMQIMQ